MFISTQTAVAHSNALTHEVTTANAMFGFRLEGFKHKSKQFKSHTFKQTAGSQGFTVWVEALP